MKFAETSECHHADAECHGGGAGRQGDADSAHGMGGVGSNRKLRGDCVTFRLEPILSSLLSLWHQLQITVEHLAPKLA